MIALRYTEYYNLQHVFDLLYERSRKGESLEDLYEIVISRENILLAYRNLKDNEGSETPGVDGLTIRDLARMSEDELVSMVRNALEEFEPQPVRRVFIPKPNGDKRPLGIPTIRDRLIQQAIRQVLEPITEARFYEHSYGFRPLRSTEHAIARVESLINQAGLHYAVDIDIKGFFDNVNHTMLMRQIWNMGIRDRRIHAIIGKMLKAPIESEGIPTKGVPQGGILSPLLSNIVLNDLDQWVAGQWHHFPSRRQYSRSDPKYRALKTTRLKEGWIIRYADDFVILARDWRSAWKWYHAVKQYLKIRLRLDISPEKSKVVNLRRGSLEFLGIAIKAIPKPSSKLGHVAVSGIKPKKRQQIKAELRKMVKELARAPSGRMVSRLNAYIRGIQNYFRKASRVGKELGRIWFDLFKLLCNRLKGKAEFGIPRDPPETYRRLYSKYRYPTWSIGGIPIFPLPAVRHWRPIPFNQVACIYTAAGRKLIHKYLHTDVETQIVRLMRSNVGDRSVEYLDNRLSRYSMVQGRCEISGVFLTAEMVHAHHVIPLSMGGDDSFENLRIIHKAYHALIHATAPKTINRLLKELQPGKKELAKVNKYRRVLGLEMIRENR
ncbi:reverse transcriptase [Hydrogenibacillus schlegelii]|uniref:Group II intron reverse transcriptase/maturase n=1 Tax=Hydrogenibacillus schlegelii TaxID=1484 RepID=A0A132NEM7_HYDSH|nr:reverse transcriptase [Hydrogenibacillus schlegelii]OAR03631.1 group II intron reverse transcriptase/maturase [Hydrogenibacillus schlegelii]